MMSVAAGPSRRDALGGISNLTAHDRFGLGGAASKDVGTKDGCPRSRLTCSCGAFPACGGWWAFRRSAGGLGG